MRQRLASEVHCTQQRIGKDLAVQKPRKLQA
jgi:hypothetical protein